MQGTSTWNTYASWINCTTATKKGCLFDIIADPTEHVDLAEQMPEVVDRMHARMVALQPTVYDPDRGPIDMDGACAALGRNRGFWTPWLNLSGHA